MPKQATRLPWTKQDWFQQASTWIHGVLGLQGIRVTGPIEQAHVRPWSIVLRAPSVDGDVYFKATAPVLAHEAALTDWLYRWRPDCMPPLLAVDVDRGWMLMPDLGATLRDLIQSTRDLEHWRRVLPIYAQVQIDLINRLPELLELGVLDRRLTVLPGKLEQLLDDTDAVLLDQPEGLTTEEHRRLNKLIPAFSATCDQLASYQIPETLHHEDFHDANVYVQNGRCIFSDWGESGVAHPFCTLLVTFRIIAWRLKLESDAPEMQHLRDTYLEAWTVYGSRKALVDAFELARRVGMVCRALTWHRVVAGANGPVKAEYAQAVPGWLQELLEAEVAPAG